MWLGRDVINSARCDWFEQSKGAWLRRSLPWSATQTFRLQLLWRSEVERLSRLVLFLNT